MRLLILAKLFLLGLFFIATAAFGLLEFALTCLLGAC
jgi:hypothetical protein